MPATAYREHHEAGGPVDLDPASLTQSLASLRQELRALANDLCASQRENAALRHELDTMREPEPACAPPAAERRPMPEVQRFKRELQEQLERLRRIAAAHARDAEEAAPEPARSSSRCDAAWLRRMMVMMMMAELV